MTKLVLILAIGMIGFGSRAESIDVKDVDSAGEGTTTIEIKKTKKTADTPEKTADKTEKPTKGGWGELQTEEIEVSGASGATAKDARQEWDKQCKVMEDKTKAEGKENGDKITGWNCGKPTCSGDVGNKTCVSTAKYKVRSKID